MLKAKGYAAYHSRVAWAADVNTRADDLNRTVPRILAETRTRKANIIAHSMGGLDARHMLFNDRGQGRIHESVASLTTIGTPHEGTSFADWALNYFPRLPAALPTIGLNINRFKD